MIIPEVNKVLNTCFIAARRPKIQKLFHSKLIMGKEVTKKKYIEKYLKALYFGN